MASLDWEGAWQFASAKRRVMRAKDVGATAAEGSAAAGASLAAGGASGDEGGLRLRLPAEGRSASSSAAGRQAQQRRLLSEGSAEQQARAAAGMERGGSGGGGVGHAAVAFWKQGGGLAHVVLPNAGHMAPRDAPEATQWMLERWLRDVAPAA